MCDPTAEPVEGPSAAMAPSHEHHGVSHDEHDEHAGHQHGAAATTTLEPGHAAMAGAPGAREAMGHGGHGGSMADMARDMRNRFVVAAALSVVVLLWSPIGRDVLHVGVPAPFGLRDDVVAMIASLPVVGYSAWIFFDGAVRALRARTLDMMVLVAVAIGASWLFSVVVTLTGDGEVFYEAATVLTTFVLLGHWLEMRARGGANDAVRTLLQLAPPRAVVLRDGEAVEVATDEVKVGDLLLIRPGANRHRRRARTWRSRRHRARDRPQGAPEPRLGDRLQRPGPAHRRGRPVRLARAVAAPRERRPDHVRLHPHRHRQRPPAAPAAPDPAGLTPPG